MADNEWMPSATTIPLTRWWSGLRIGERRVLLLLGDLIMLSIALAITLWVMQPRGGPPRVRISWWFVLWALWIPIAIIAECYDLERASKPTESVLYSAAWSAVVALGYLLVPVISAPLTQSRVHFFLFLLLAVGGVSAWRLAYATLVWQPTFRRRVLVVGAGQTGRQLAEAIDASKEVSGLQLVGFIDDDESLTGQRIADHPVLATSEGLISFAEQLRVDEIVLAITDLHHINSRLLSALVRCWSRGVAVIPMLLYLEELTQSLPITATGQNIFALVNHNDVMLRRLWDAIRRLADIVVGGLGLVALAPITPFLALAIHIDSPGPVFYRQQRVGQGGRLFWLTKFRSMVPNAERDGAVWSRDGDARVTRAGRLMRKTRLDELPQLWNLLVGDMTLIGPRPERPEFVRQLDNILPYYAIRYSVKPGLTGWAQVRYRYGSSVEDALVKLRYDLYYVKHRGPLLDAVIVLHTVRVVLQMKGT